MLFFSPALTIYIYRMMNIIHAGKKKVNNKWHNGDLILKKYGIPVKYLAEQSWDCQLKHGAPNFDPYKSGSVTYPTSTTLHHTFQN